MVGDMLASKINAEDQVEHLVGPWRPIFLASDEYSSADNDQQQQRQRKTMRDEDMQKRIQSTMQMQDPEVWGHSMTLTHRCRCHAQRPEIVTLDLEALVAC